MQENQHTCRRFATTVHHDEYTASYMYVADCSHHQWRTAHHHNGRTGIHVQRPRWILAGTQRWLFDTGESYCGKKRCRYIICRGVLAVCCLSPNWRTAVTRRLLSLTVSCCQQSGTVSCCGWCYLSWLILSACNWRIVPTIVGEFQNANIFQISNMYYCHVRQL